MTEIDFILLAKTVAEAIEARFPGKPILTPKQVAEVMGQHPDTVRDRLLHGTLVPGLRKDHGRWRVPVDKLVAAIESLTEPDGPAPVPTRSQIASTASPFRKGRPLDAYRARRRAHMFWQAVFAEVDHARLLARVEADRKALATLAGIELDQIPRPHDKI